MRAFWAIVVLTMRNALRSRIFQVLLLMLALGVWLIPATTQSEGSAMGYIQVSLRYSLSVVTFILSLSALWLSCYIMTTDVDGYQIHMVVTKPVSRLKIWFAKWFSIVLMHTVLLFISLAVVFSIIMYQFKYGEFSDQDRLRVENEVLVGRRSFKPQMEDLDAVLRQKLIDLQQSKIRIGEKMDEVQLVTAEHDLRRELKAQFGEVLPGKSRTWVYNNLPTNEPAYLRYRIFIASYSDDKQRETQGLWLAGRPVFDKRSDGSEVVDPRAGDKYTFHFWPLSSEMLKIYGGQYQELEIPVGAVAPDGRAEVEYFNYDVFTRPDGTRSEVQFFQPGDGPFLMVKVCGFSENFLRGVIAMLFQVITFATLGCAAAAVVSMTTAIFISISYLVIGALINILPELSSYHDISSPMFYFSKVVEWLFVPLQKFDVSGMLSEGIVIDWSYIGELFLYVVILRVAVIATFCINCFTRRELGLVVRK